MKDIGEEIAVLGDRPLPESVARVRQVVDDEEQALAIFTDVFDGVFRHLAAILDTDGVLPQDAFWALVRECVDQHAADHPGLETRRRPACRAVRALVPQPAPAAEHPADGGPDRPVVVAHLRRHAREPDRMTVFRDAFGVPHVRAADPLALAREQGLVTARDRGWQIEVDRWRAEGRLAERIGADGVEWDRFARRARLADTAQRAYAALADEDRAFVDAYVEGVNAVATRRPRRAARTAAHEPWPAWVPLGIMLVNHALFSMFPRLLWNEHVRLTLGDDAVDLFDSAETESSGTNAWALHGSRTASGKPLLAGDPHRMIEMPGVYQQVRLACPEFDVLGLAFPGVPGVQHFGHTGTAAWGITNAIAHHVEVFRERLSDDGRPALGPDGWAPVEPARRDDPRARRC